TFWARRDPTPDTPTNEAREDFYQRVQHANRAYRGISQNELGWRSDRGRIYLRNGEPVDVLRESAHGTGSLFQGSSMSYEVWGYRRAGKDRFYIFVDRTGAASFKLIHTNDVRETRDPGWEEYFGRDDFENIERFLGPEVFRVNY